MRVLSLLAALVATAISSTDAVWPSGVKLAGLNYDTQRCYGEAVMIADLQAIARIAKSVRVYGLGTTGECSIMNLLKNAKNAGLTVGLGMWLDDKTNFDNQLAGLEAVIKTGAITSNVIGFHVGSEAIYRKDHTADQAIDYLKRTRAMFQKYKIDMKLTIADVVDMYYQYPQLLNAVDYVSINQFSFWEKVDPNVAMEKMLDRIRSIRAQAASQGKEVIISETGWASDGVDPKDRCSVPSVANQRLFFNNFYHQITAHGIPYYWFVAFDLPWNDKDGVTVERYFGVMNAGDRSIKASYQGVDFTPRNITTVQSSRGLLAETFNVAAPDEVKGVEITQYATDNLAKFRYQWFWDSGKKQFRSVNSDRCLDAYEPQNGGTVHTYTCSETNANQQWRYDAATQQIQHVTHAGFCLEDRVAEGKIQLWKCDTSNVNQRWGFAAPPRRTCPKIDDDIDYLGNDIGSEKSATAEGCCSICASHAGCNAFSWNNFNGGTCWLKSAKGSITGKFGTRSAVIADVTPAPFTPAPTTPAPTTLAPTVTPVPTTTAPVTPVPTTTAPVTPVPTTTAPVTPVPTTTAPVTPTPSTCSTIEQNVDYIGNDLSSAASNTAGGCCDICKAKAGCKAFSWTNYQGGTCWLKTGKGQTAVSSGVLSAVVNSGTTPEPTTPTPTTPKPTTPAPTTGAPGACPAIENNIDYVGNDIGNALSATADGCCSICLAKAGCNAFSWSDYMGGTCWLKSGKGQTIAKTGARSAVMRTGCSPVEVDVDYTGADVGNEKSTTVDGCCTICRNNSKCKAYTWTDYMGGTCWLKSAKGSGVAKAGAKSATVL